MNLVTLISLSTASGMWRWLFCQKGQLRPHNPWCWNYQTSESENKGKAIVLCLQQDLRTEDNELNCQSANGYTMGKQAWDSINCRLLLVISSLRLVDWLRVFTFCLVHKPNNPGRPIVPACSCPTELISILLDKIVAPCHQIFTFIH